MSLTYHGKRTSSKHYPRRVSQTFLDVASDLGLEQMVDFPTRGDNTLGLIFTSHPSFQERCKPLPPISDKSDHDIVLFDTSHQPVRARPFDGQSYCERRLILIGSRRHLSVIVTGSSLQPSTPSTACGKTSRPPLTNS